MNEEEEVIISIEEMSKEELIQFITDELTNIQIQLNKILDLIEVKK